MKKTIGKTKEKVLRMALLFSLVCGCAAGCSSGALKEESAVSYNTDAAEEAYDMDAGFDFNEMESEQSYEMKETADDAAPAAEANASAAEGGETQMADDTSAQDMNTSQKIIKRYNYSYETEHFDDAYNYLKEQIQDYNGYISMSEIVGSSYYKDYRTLYLTARIPAENSEAFVGDLGQLGTIVRQSESAEDVTLQYSDTESRIASLKTEQQRLNELLEQADGLETIIALEERMTDVRYELESYQSKKKLYDNLIRYSTIEITLEEVSYTVEVDNSTFFSRVTSGLESSFRDIAEGAVELAEWLIIKSPYLLLFVIIIFIIVKVIRKIVRRKRNKKNKMQQINTVMQPADSKGTEDIDSMKKKDK